MPLDEQGAKWACEPCIRGHRSSKCDHFDRLMLKVPRAGRPLAKCPHLSNTCSCKKTYAFMIRIPKGSSCVCRLLYEVPSNDIDSNASTQDSSTNRPESSVSETRNDSTARPSKRTKTTERPPCCTETVGDAKLVLGANIKRTADGSTHSSTNSVASLSSTATAEYSGHRSSVTSDSSLKRSRSCCSVESKQSPSCGAGSEESTPQPDKNVTGSTARTTTSDEKPYSQPSFLNPSGPQHAVPPPGPRLVPEQGVDIGPSLVPQITTTLAPAHQNDELLAASHYASHANSSQIPFSAPGTFTSHPNTHHLFDAPVPPALQPPMTALNYPLSTYNPSLQTNDFSAMCSCGDACRCLACPVHPYNASMRQYVQGMGTFSLLDNDVESSPTSAMPTPTLAGMSYPGLGLNQHDGNPYYLQDTYAAPNISAANSASIPHDQFNPSLSVYSAKYNELIMERGAYYEMPYPVDLPENVEILNNADPLNKEDWISQDPTRQQSHNDNEKSNDLNTADNADCCRPNDAAPAAANPVETGKRDDS